MKQFETEINDKSRVKRGRNGYVETPFPPGTFLSVMGDPDHNIPPPDEAEIEQVKALGYQNAVGNLNWAARHSQFRLILAKVGWRLEFRLLNQLLLEIYYRSVTHAIHKISTGRSYSRIASSCVAVITAPRSVR